MIVYLASEVYAGLFQREGWMIKTYIQWKGNVSDFIKKEYANLMTAHPEAMIVDELAVSDRQDVSILKRTFPEVEVILLTKEKEAGILEDCKVVSADENVVEKVEEILYPELKKRRENGRPKLKIGILPEDGKSMDAAVSTAFHILSCLSENAENVCLIEVAKESRLPLWAKQYGWNQTEEGYEYQEIPIFHNAVLEKQISIFLFLDGEEEKSRNMHGKCDVPLKIKKTDKKEIELRFYDKVCFRKEIKHPFQDKDGTVYQELFGKQFGLSFKKQRKNETAETGKKEKKEKKKKAGNISKWKKRGILAFLLLAVFCLMTAVTIRLQDTKEKELKGAVQKQAESTRAKGSTMEETTLITAQAEKKTRTTAKKKKTAAEKKTSVQVTKKNTGNTGRQTRSTRATGKKRTTTRKKKVTTARKKTTTTVKEKTTTAKKKPTTTQTFDVDYDVQ